MLHTETAPTPDPGVDLLTGSPSACLGEESPSRRNLPKRRLLFVQRVLRYMVRPSPASPRLSRSAMPSHIASSVFLSRSGTDRPRRGRACCATEAVLAEWVRSTRRTKLRRRRASRRLPARRRWPAVRVAPKRPRRTSLDEPIRLLNGASASESNRSNKGTQGAPGRAVGPGIGLRPHCTHMEL